MVLLQTLNEQICIRTISRCCNEAHCQSRAKAGKLGCNKGALTLTSKKVKMKKELFLRLIFAKAIARQANDIQNSLAQLDVSLLVCSNRTLADLSVLPLVAKS